MSRMGGRAGWEICAELVSDVPRVQLKEGSK